MRSVRTKIRISEGKRKLACSLPSESIFGAAKDTNKPSAKASLLAFFPRRSILGPAKDTNKPSAKASLLAFFPRRSILGTAKDTNKPSAKAACLRFFRGAVSWAQPPQVRSFSCEEKRGCCRSMVPVGGGRSLRRDALLRASAPGGCGPRGSVGAAFGTIRPAQRLVKSIACVCSCPRHGVYFGFRRRSAAPRQKHRLRLLLPSACTIFARENGEQAPATNTIPI